MCVLNTSSLLLEPIDSVEATPLYSALSTWGKEDVAFEEIQSLGESELRTRKGYEEICYAATAGRIDCLSHIWVDTCCINKLCSDERIEAINSMFRWYRNAATCYIYLSGMRLDTIADGSSMCSAFTQSRWFNGGWTLPEWLAPRHVTFYDEHWSWLGTIQDLQQRISRLAGIPERVGEDLNELVKLNTAQKMSWVTRTTQTEDMAYYLLGILGRHMPLCFREGDWKFYRLQPEILKTTHDLLLFACSGSGKRLGGILATSPQHCLGAGSIIEEAGHKGIYKGYQGILEMPLPMVPLSRHYDHREDFTAPNDQRMVSKQEDVLGKESQILGWVIAIQDSLTECKDHHSGVGETPDRTEKPKNTLRGILEADSEVTTLFRSHTSSRSSRIISWRKSFPGVQGPIPDIQYTQDEEWAVATNDEDTEEFRSESSDSDSESCSTVSTDSEDDSEDELLLDIFIEVLVEVILERKGMPWHLMGGKSGANANVQRGRHGNALQAASYGGHKQVVKFLLENGADVNAHGGQYGTALQAALYGDQLPVAKLLLDRGANVNAQGERHDSALLIASHRGQEQVVKLLLDTGIDINAQSKRHHGNALQVASYGGHEQVVKLLLDAGADVNAHGGEYGNALQAASYRGHEQVVKLLLDTGVGADVNAQGGRHGNALQAALYGGHEQVVKLLLEAGADVNAQDGRHGNALRTAPQGGYSQAADGNIFGRFDKEATVR